MNLVILDRDGVINEDAPDYVKAPEEWHPIPGSLEAIAKLSHAGVRVFIASNQSAIGRRLMTLADLADVHRAMQAALNELGAAVEALFFCPHKPTDGCACRKPRPGLLRAIGRRCGAPLDGVPFIGDTMRDVKAARAVGARPVLVRTGKGDNITRFPQNVAVHDNLAAAVEALLAEE